MRLLKCLPTGGFGLTSYDDEQCPPYAILSHTWAEGHEVTYDELLAATGTDKSGYEKLRFCGERAAVDNLQYFWVDTCCINKAAADEVSTAINSMFRWYQRASKCYVYLADVSVPEEVGDAAEAYRITWAQAFQSSRWFTRGWTLQELLAPASVEFFSREGWRLGNKISLEQEIHKITGICVDALRNPELNDFSPKERMNWAKDRKTTRVEDKVYCLLGIFKVFLPLIYGEGEEYATLRLEEEIRKRHRPYTMASLQYDSALDGRNGSDIREKPVSMRSAADVLNTQEAMKNTRKRGTPNSSAEHESAKRHRINIGDSIMREGPSGSSAENSREASYALPVDAQLQSRIPLSDEQKRCFLESLRFEQIDARQMTIKAAHAKTCKWLLKHPQYLDWLDATKLDEHHGFLWIKGKAGSGKSTLMKSAMIHARKSMKNRTTLSFFFNARGEEIERSTLGMYRSLLLQLLEQIPAQQSIFRSLEVPASSLTADYCWNINSLKILFEQAINALEKCLVVCFIDALDEGVEDQVRDMIQFFEHIGDLSIINGVSFQVCLASRHYPHITIRNGLELILEGQEGHAQDITNYVETELKIGKSKVAQQVRAELQEKASGIFMWVVLVIGILNKEFDSGQILTLRRKLREIPGDLYELFHDILTRDLNHQEMPVLCIQWVLFAKQPLTPEQLWHAIYSGVAPKTISAWDSEEMSKDDIKRFILHASKGLAEATVSNKPRVQFIHESVRDFLLKENGLGRIWPEYASNFDGQSHEKLKQCCLNYVSLDVATPFQISGHLLRASSEQRAYLRKSATQMFPLLEYAVQNLLYHADNAQGTGLSQADFLGDFPLSPWIKLHNLLEKHVVRRHTEHVSLLYMLAEHNAGNLIRVHPSADSCFDEEDERYGCAFFAANATGGHEAMREFIRHLENTHNSPDNDEQLREGTPEGMSVLNSLGRNFKYSKNVNPASYAMTINNPTVLAGLLVARKLQLDVTIKRGETLLYVAAEQGKAHMFRVLLDKGANVNMQGGHYGTALQAASTHGYKDIVVELLDKGADINVQGGHYGTALEAAEANRFEDIVALLRNCLNSLGS